ncbi:MAG: DUF86 domain-containing protein, partial [Chloroflexota bacterium]
DIPWRRIAGLRDVLIHNYMGFDVNAVWEITQQNLPRSLESLSLMRTQAPSVSCRACSSMR